jgi:S1-C subfamily serine protease
MFKRVGMLAFLGSCAFAGGAAGFILLPRFTAQLTAQTPMSPAAADASLTRLSERFEWASNKVLPAVVSVEAVKAPQPGKPRPTEESGSGVIIQGEPGKNVYVITNNHVVAFSRPEKITITLSDGKVFRPSHAWTDPESDVAVLRIDKSGLPTATFGDSDKVRVGQWVLAVGSPFGLNQSVTHGIISARERGQISLGGGIRIKDFLQTDAAINPGSSGGPLINLDGEVIGINTAIASQTNSNSGVAFSIPINLVRRVARQLLEKGSVSRGYLGMHLASALEATDALKLGLESANGALVDSVYPDTPAAAAGIQIGDVILKLNDTHVKNENHLINMISAMPAGQQVKLSIWRNRRPEVVQAVVGDWGQAQTRLKPAQ